MEESRTDQDEEELQKIMEENPPSEFAKCIFCDSRATQYIEAEELGLEVPQDVDGPVPICDGCRLDQNECMACLFGDYCEHHPGEEESLLGRVALAWLAELGWQWQEEDDDDEG